MNLAAKSVITGAETPISIRMSFDQHSLGSSQETSVKILNVPCDIHGRIPVRAGSVAARVLTLKGPVCSSINLDLLVDVLVMAIQTCRRTL